MMESFNRADVNNPDTECVYCGSVEISRSGGGAFVCSDCQAEYFLEG